MPFNLLSNIIFIASVFGIIVLVLRRLPEAASLDAKEKQITSSAAEKLAEKGLPAKAVSKTRTIIKVGASRAWQFMLEAKGLSHAPKINYQLKKILRKDGEREIGQRPIARSEEYYIQLIKRHPKDLSAYDQLGQFYFEARKFGDAANVYEYMAKHDPTHSAYFAKLGLSRLHNQEFTAAAQAYEQAMTLDQSHPNRYYNLALAYQGNKQWRPAAASLRKALELEPTNQKYKDLLFEMEHKVTTAVPVENIHKKA